MIKWPSKREHERINLLFVLGSARSGTSATCWAIRCTRYAGFHEGHVLDFIQHMFDCMDNYYSTRKKAIANKKANMIGGIEKTDLEKVVLDFFRQKYADLHPGSSYIVDKTPTSNAIKSIGVAQKLFPDAKFIYCRRRGIENVLSKQRKWPDVAFKNHCHMWSAAMNEWFEKRALLNGNYIELDQFDMLNNPDEVATKIADYLGLDENEKCLISDSFKTDRYEKTADSYEPVSFEDLDWSDEKKQMFNQICGPAMERYEYTYDSTYRTKE